jgi:hypothetical protein
MEQLIYLETWTHALRNTLDPCFVELIAEMMVPL